MRLANFLALSFVLLISMPVFAFRMLSYPVGQPPECNQSYEAAPEPKSSEQVFSALQAICVKKGGDHVASKQVRSGNSIEPTDELFSCIGENPVDYTLFTCAFSASKQ